MSEEIKGELLEYKPPMGRSIGVKRLYALANYNNITFDSVLENIPEKFALNSDLVNKVYYLQMIECEKAYRKYLQLYAKIKTFSVEQYAEALTVLEQEKEETTLEIKKLFYEQGE